MLDLSGLRYKRRFGPLANKAQKRHQGPMEPYCFASPQLDLFEAAGIVDHRFAGRVARKLRLTPRKLVIIHPETAVIHRRSPFDS